MYPFVLVAGAIALVLCGGGTPATAPGRVPRGRPVGGYAVYEYYVANGTLCDANCNIRVDLVFFFPLLAWATYLALRKEPSTGAVAVSPDLPRPCRVAGFTFGYPAVAVIAGMAALHRRRLRHQIESLGQSGVTDAVI